MSAGCRTRALAKVIADEQVDLLVDLNGYSDTDRLGLFMLRPAPVIVGWFNMYATTAHAVLRLLDRRSSRGSGRTKKSITASGSRGRRARI